MYAACSIQYIILSFGIYCIVCILCVLLPLILYIENVCRLFSTIHYLKLRHLLYCMYTLYIVVSYRKYMPLVPVHSIILSCAWNTVVRTVDNDWCICACCMQHRQSLHAWNTKHFLPGPMPPPGYLFSSQKFCPNYGTFAKKLPRRERREEKWDWFLANQAKVWIEIFSPKD